MRARRILGALAAAGTLSGSLAAVTQGDLGRNAPPSQVSYERYCVAVEPPPSDKPLPQQTVCVPKPVLELAIRSRVTTTESVRGTTT